MRSTSKQTFLICEVLRTWKLRLLVRVADKDEAVLIAADVLDVVDRRKVLAVTVIDSKSKNVVKTFKV